MKQVKLSEKIIGAFVFVILLMTGVAGICQFSARRMSQGFQNLLNGQVALERHAAQADSLLGRALSAKDSFLLTRDPALMTEHRQRVDGLIEQLTAVRAIEEQDDPVRAKAVAGVIALARDYRELTDSLTKAQKRMGLDESKGYQGQFRKSAHILEQAMLEHDLDELAAAFYDMQRVAKEYMSGEGQFHHERFRSALARYATALKESRCDPLAKKIQQEALDRCLMASQGARSGFDAGREGDLRQVALSMDVMERAIKSVNVPGAKALMLTIRKHEKDFLLRGAPKYAQQTRMAVTTLRETFDTAGLADAHIGEVNNLLTAYWQSFDALARERATIEDLKEKIRMVAQQMGPLIDEIAVEANIAGVQETRDIENQAQSLTKGALVASISALVLATGLTIALVRTICRPIDLAVHNMISGAEQVSTASGQVSAASQLLAEGASEQAAALEETSASLEEMAAMTQRNSDHAVRADALMRATMTTIQEADETMREMGCSMREIAEASNSTAKVIATIDEIAFQTNLLALNAAVEAARAGEAGAGFAIVADEVRRLAQRAAEAANDTGRQIEITVAKVLGGKVMVEKSLRAFREVKERSDDIASLIGEIATASGEQAQGIALINQAVSQMDVVTQQNSATAEESAASATELNGLSANMTSVVKELQNLITGDAPIIASRRQPAQRLISQLA